MIIILAKCKVYFILGQCVTRNYVDYGEARWGQIRSEAVTGIWYLCYQITAGS